MLVANQKTNNIVVFNINQDTGQLTPTGTNLKVNQPMCLKFLR
jgi:6-phosphogluconolactonase